MEFGCCAMKPGASLFLPHRAPDFPPSSSVSGGLCLPDNCSLSQGEQVRCACPKNPWLVFISYSFARVWAAPGKVIHNMAPNAQVLSHQH